MTRVPTKMVTHVLVVNREKPTFGPTLTSSKLRFVKSKNMFGATLPDTLENSEKLKMQGRVSWGRAKHKLLN